MSKRTELLVLTLWSPFWVQERRTELGFVLVWVVEFFYSIVGSVAFVSVRAIYTLLCHLALLLLPTCQHMRTHLRLVSPQWSPPVLGKVVVEGTALVIVVLGVLSALFCLEGVQIQERDALIL